MTSSSSSSSTCLPLTLPANIRFNVSEISGDSCNAACNFSVDESSYPPKYHLEPGSLVNVEENNTIFTPTLDSNGCVNGWELSINISSGNPGAGIRVFVQDGTPSDSPLDYEGDYIVPGSESYTGSAKGVDIS